jgi:hypothetical protein
MQLADITGKKTIVSNELPSLSVQNCAENDAELLDLSSSYEQSTLAAAEESECYSPGDVSSWTQFSQPQASFSAANQVMDNSSASNVGDQLVNVLQRRPLSSDVDLSAQWTFLNYYDNSVPLPTCSTSRHAERKENRVVPCVGAADARENCECPQSCAADDSGAGFGQSDSEVELLQYIPPTRQVCQLCQHFSYTQFT